MGRNDDTTAAVLYVARFVGGGGGGGEIVGSGGGGYKESRPWCALFVGFPSLLVAPSGEQLLIYLLMCWRGTSLSTISRVFVPIYFYGQSVVVDVEGVGFRPRAVVLGGGEKLCLCLDAPAFLAKDMFSRKVSPRWVTCGSI